MNVVASYYGTGDGFHGKTTASCTRFKRNARTVAHRRLPFGTKVRLENPKTGRTSFATVTDYGPRVRKRTLDVSTMLANELGFYAEGTTNLLLVVLDVPEKPVYGQACKHK